MKRRSLWLALALSLVLAACTTVQPIGTPTAGQPAPAEAQATAQQGARLATVKARGRLVCGVNGGLPGFSNLEPSGEYTGFDADFCRAIAAALFDDPNAVEFRPLTAAERFTALQTGEIDVLIRNTTWTLNRDTAVKGDFGPVIFYDGQGIMVRADSGITDLQGLAGGTICVQAGTTTLLNITDQMRARNIEFTPLTFEDIDTTYTSYEQRRCDAVTSDRSQLAARRTVMENPDEHVILPIVLSKEPLAPVVLHGDQEWADVVRWVVFATVQAEEFGITSQNVDQFMASENPDIARFLGTTGNLGVDLGLTNDFAVRIIRHVGNYGEIFERNLGANTPFAMERGLNALWTQGGLLYSPPFR